MAYLLFSFVDAPLGAIVHRGGMGTPMILAVLIFIIYYVISTLDLKVTSNEQISAWVGMWLSSAVILPLGTLLTCKASRDSATLNVSAYMVFLRCFFHPSYAGQLEYKRVIIEPTATEEVLHDINQL